MGEPTVIYEARDGIARITLNRPEAMNAFNRALLAELKDCLNRAANDNSTKVVILSGAGGKAFSAGADLTELVEYKKAEEHRDHFGGVASIIATLEQLPQPTIAAVKGYALAGGCGLAAACDIVIATEDSIFGTPEINLGLLPMIIMAPIVRAVGTRKAFYLMITGERISAEEAMKMGLVNEVVPPDKLEERVMQISEKIASFSTAAIKMGKEGFYNMLGMNYTQSIKYLREVVSICSMTDAAKESIRAFLERKRKKK